MTRRFIAGAVCPRCGEMDKLLVDSETNRRECVSCGYSDERPTDAQTELRTRVNRPQRLQETTPEPVRLVDTDTGKPGEKDD